MTCGVVGNDMLVSSGADETLTRWFMSASTEGVPKGGSGSGYRLSQVKTDQLITNDAGYKDNPRKRPANWVTCVANQDSDRKALLVGDSSGYLTSINSRGTLINQKVMFLYVVAWHRPNGSEIWMGRDMVT